jgi:TRAP-type C4-dicarboxylate transport system permease small subunit
MFLERLEKLAEKISLIGAYVAAFLLVYMVCHILIEIFFRTVLDSSTYSLDEFVGYAVGAMTFLSLGHSFQRKSLIRVNILTNSIKGLTSRIVEVLCICFTFFIISFFARYVWRSLTRNFERGTVSPTLTETPIWLVETVFFIGLSIFLFQMFVSAIMTIFKKEKIN